MLAETAKKPFSDPEWLFEIKWDGYRAIADNRNGIQLYSRNGRLFTKGFATIYENLQLQKHRMILDGELVVFDENDEVSFQALQQIERQHAEVVFQVFDLLWLNGHSTVELSLIERKELLKEALVETDYIRYHDHIEERGTDFFNLIVEKNLEGMIAKKKSSKYFSGKRSGNWLKVKNLQREQVFICGYTAPRGERKYFGSLIIGEMVNQKLQFRGHVGTGFSDDTLKKLYHLMQEYTQTECPFSTIPQTNDVPTWLRPKLKIEIKFTEQTNNGIYRHAVYVGLNQDTIEKNTIPPEVKNKVEMPYSISNPEKVFWPESNITKFDLAAYYQQIQQFILPHLANRPQSMNRFPDGINGINFYQKNAPDFASEQFPTVQVFSEHSNRTIDYLICNDETTLAFMNNLGCIDFNPWASQAFHLDFPDYLFLDLDPAENNSFAEVVYVTKTVKNVLDEVGIPGYCKTSGSTGMHIYIPLGRKYSFEQARNFAHLLMLEIHYRLPELTTVERSLKDRPSNTIYLDYLQNRRGQTLASVYSVRPKPLAPVSTPLHWDELDEQMLPTDFTIKNVPDRLSNVGDLFKGVLGDGIEMLEAIEKLESSANASEL